MNKTGYFRTINFDTSAGDNYLCAVFSNSPA
jgi:hypothetical protein